MVGVSPPDGGKYLGPSVHRPADGNTYVGGLIVLVIVVEVVLVAAVVLVVMVIVVVMLVVVHYHWSGVYACIISVQCRLSEPIKHLRQI